jgi:hypothetical protein
MASDGQSGHFLLAAHRIVRDSVLAIDVEGKLGLSQSLPQTGRKRTARKDFLAFLKQYE